MIEPAGFNFGANASAEEAAFARGVEVEALMDQAGAGVARAVTKFFRKPGTCIVFAGKGHNAGDALVAAECLRRRGWKIEIRLAFQEAIAANSCARNLKACAADGLRSGRDPAAAELIPASSFRTLGGIG